MHCCARTAGTVEEGYQLPPLYPFWQMVHGNLKTMKIVLFLCLATWLLMPHSAWGQSRMYDEVPRRSWTYIAYRRLVKMGFAQPASDTSGYERIFTRYEFAVVTDRLTQQLANRKKRYRNEATIRKLVHRLAKEFHVEIKYLHRAPERIRAASRKISPMTHFRKEVL